MPDSYARIILHTTFSTRYRKPMITERVEPLIFKTIKRQLFRFGSTTMAINGVVDHIHIVHTLPRTVTVAKLIQEAKKWSAANVNKEIGSTKMFSWQDGYATFSVNYQEVDAAIAYVQNQKIHHGGGKAESFEVEYARYLRAHGFDPESEYLFPDAS